jgi:hypothetical protein
VERVDLNALSRRIDLNTLSHRIDINGGVCGC